MIAVLSYLAGAAYIFATVLMVLAYRMFGYQLDEGEKVTTKVAIAAALATGVLFILSATAIVAR